MTRIHSGLLRVLAVAAMVLALVSVSKSAFAAAADTYKAKCAMCHGADGKGNTPAGKKMGAHDFSSPEVQKMSDDELGLVIAKGKNKMPAYEKSMKDADVKEMVTYIRQLGK